MGAVRERTLLSMAVQPAEIAVAAHSLFDIGFFIDYIKIKFVS
jgi:hypothetical protein